MVGIPAFHVPTSVVIYSDQVDSNGSPTMTFTWGILSGTYGDGTPAVARTIGTEYGSALTAPVRAGGWTPPAATNTGIGRALATTGARGVGIKVTAAIATLVTGAVIRMKITYVADPDLLT
jgi:hypothetical protein